MYIRSIPGLYNIDAIFKIHSNISPVLFCLYARAFIILINFFKTVKSGPASFTLKIN